MGGIRVWTRCLVLLGLMDGGWVPCLWKYLHEVRDDVDDEDAEQGQYGDIEGDALSIAQAGLENMSNEQEDNEG